MNVALKSQALPPSWVAREPEMDMKHYLLSVCYPAGGTPPPPAKLDKIMRDLAALRREMQAAGAWVFAGGLQPPNAAAVVRHQNDEAILTDGPFIEAAGNHDAG